MEAGGKDAEEETLQMAFKKLRVDAESVPGAVGPAEASRGAARATVEGSGAKSKLSCPKDGWHSCTRKTSRGVSRIQRRRRSKSPILHPPKFTYSSSSSASLSPPGGGLKQQRLAVPPPLVSCPAATVTPPSSSSSPSSPAAPAETCCASGPADRSSPLVFGSAASCVPPNPGEEKNAETADFRALSQLHAPTGASAEGVSSSTPTCSCSSSSSSAAGSDTQTDEGRCRCWHGVEVYSFTGLRNVISECEQSHQAASRTQSSSNAAAAAASTSSAAAGSPRSCSEQARAYVDDITIEDLSGYMEYYLYIPKKMSHMAEMMYT